MDAKRPIAEAIKITQVLQALPDDSRFPVDVKQVAMELSRIQHADPIVSITPIDGDGFEGILVRHPSGTKWKIGYSSKIQSEGRVRFTLAHEFGHYILHRARQAQFQCSTRDMHEWDQLNIEGEADIFASFLLMPLDDFRNQVVSQSPSIELIRHCSSRYGVSLMAAALKWTETTQKRAVVIASRDGFVLWARSSPSAYESRVYLATRKAQHPIAVPSNSILSSATPERGPVVGQLSASFWFDREPSDSMVVEHALALTGDYPYTLGLLILPDSPPRWNQEEDELLPPVDQVLKGGLARR